MIASHIGWDLNPRILGVVLKEVAPSAPCRASIGSLDAQAYWAIPKGVSNDKLVRAAGNDQLLMLDKPAGAGSDSLR